MNRFRELGYSLDELKTMDPKVVEKAFYPPENLRRSKKPMPDFESVYHGMKTMKHPDLAYFWYQYREEHPDGYGLPQYYKLYGDFVSENYGEDKVSMPVERVPGEKMYIDWVGDQPELLTNPSTGELNRVA